MDEEKPGEIPSENVPVNNTAELATEPLQEAIATTPPPIINEPEMEVHHHAHHDHGKKNWRSYFQEFLMLFLAVFCGSLAEYQLEHYVEKQKAKDFAVSLHNDLAMDTANMKLTVNKLQFCARKTDTLIALLRNTNELQQNTAKIYQYSVYAFIMPITAPTESTLQQLLNSGSLRYFRDNKLVDSIKGYNNAVQQLKKFLETASDFNIEFRKVQLSVLEINPIIEYIPRIPGYRDSNPTNIPDSSFTKLTLLTTDANKLKEYINWCALKRFYMINSAAFYKKVGDHGKSLLEVLDK